MEKMAAAATPTTFVQADAHTFRDLVQKLTGANDDCADKLPVTMPARMAAREVGGPRRPGFKLQERRQNMRKLEIKLGLTSLRNAGFSSSSPRSPSLNNHHHPPHSGGSSPAASPVTPLISDTLLAFPGSRSESPSPVISEEEKVIAEKGFYLSPLSTPRGADPPELLPLFPMTSPK